MRGIIVCLAVLALIELVMLARALQDVETERQARKKAEQDAYPWDWTREREKKARALQELACDRCAYRERCSKDELDEACASCPVPDAVWTLTDRRRSA